MIEEAFVDFYTAEKLKEKGWNQNTMARYIVGLSFLILPSYITGTMRI